MTAINTLCGPKHSPLSATALASQWMREGWQLFRLAPFRLFGLLLALFLLEGLIQALVPVVGMVLSKWVMGISGAIIWLALHQLECTGKLQPLRALSKVRGKWLPLGLLALFSVAIYACQVLIAWIAAGPEVAAMFAGGQIVQVHPIVLMGVLASGVPFATLLLFVAPRLLIDRQSLGKAISGGVFAIASNAAAVSLLMLLSLLAVALAPTTMLLSVLLSGPWILCVSYAAYQSIGCPAKDPHTER